MQRSSRLIALALLLVAGFGSAAHADPPIKIAVVDMQRAMNETEDGRKAKSNLKKVFEERQKQLDKQQNDLKTMKESLEKQRDVLSRDVLAKKLEEYQKAFGELQTTYMEFQRELQSKEGELTRDIIERMQRIMRRVGQTDGYTLVLERNESGVVFVPSNYDLTDLLIQRYNAGEGKAEGAGDNVKVPAASAPKPPLAAKPK
jgi:outer membrane protein